MAINPENITTVRVDQLAEDTLHLTNEFPHSYGSELKKATIQQLVDLVSTTISTSGGVGFLPISVTDGQQLPGVPLDPSFFLCGAGTYLNVNGYPNIVCTEDLNAIMSLSDHWELAVEIPIDAISGGGGGSSTILLKTYAELISLIGSSGLLKGQTYLLTDYETTYTQPVTSASKSSGVIEQLYLIATDVNKLHNVGRSKLYPEDIIYYSINPDVGDGNGDEGFTKGKIYRRIDTIRNNDIGTDWRHVKYDRGGVDKLLFEDYTGCYDNKIPTYYLFNNVFGASFNYNSLGFYCEKNTLGDNFSNNTAISDFNNNQIGNDCMRNKFHVPTGNNTIGNGFFCNEIQNQFTDNIIGDNFKNINVENGLLTKNLSAISELYGKNYSHKITRNPDNTYQFSYIDNYGDTIIEDIP